MSNFTIFPAMDILDGKVVRLQKGDKNKVTEYSNDVVATATHWIDAGASWLHIVNLNGAFDQSSDFQQAALKQLIATASKTAQLQFGGGIRTLADMERYFNWGVNRLIISTLAISQPDLFTEALHHWGAERFVLAVDARNNRVQIQGWQTSSNQTPTSLAQQFQDAGLQNLLFTSIEQDGMGTGIDFMPTLDLQTQTGMQVIASGGAQTLKDVVAARKAGLAGIILGRSIYERSINLKEALAC